MARPKNRTNRRQIKPLGVSERLGDAPPSHYRHTPGKRPSGTDTYEALGVVHTYDGKCHDDCLDVR